MSCAVIGKQVMLHLQAVLVAQCHASPSLL